MKRPGPTGLVILLAFAIPVVIEARTLFAMLGFDIPARIYLPAAAVVLAIVFSGLLLLPEKEPPEGNPGSV